MVIIIEGPSETGKTKLAKALEKQKFKFIKFKKPLEDYYKTGYSGPSYYDAIMDMLHNVLHSENNVVFDRSPLSEIIYSECLGRTPLLTEKQFDEILKFINGGFDVKFYVLKDLDPDQHWNRHSLKYPSINKKTFDKIVNNFNKMAEKYSLKVASFQEVCDIHSINFNAPTAKKVEKAIVNEKVEEKEEEIGSDIIDIDYKINMANVIKRVLKGRIIKGKTEIHNILEQNVRDFLNSKLSNIFNPEINTSGLTNEEMLILKDMANRVMVKIKNGGR